jgi:hypothetical protein
MFAFLCKCLKKANNKPKQTSKATIATHKRVTYAPLPNQASPQPLGGQKIPVIANPGDVSLTAGAGQT